MFASACGAAAPPAARVATANPQPTSPPASPIAELLSLEAQSGRLLARPPTDGPSAAGEPGMSKLGIIAERDTMMYVPPGYDPARPTPLLVLLHGAGGNTARLLALLQPLADEAGLILLIPNSRGSTWDVIIDGFGPDVVSIDAAVQEALRRCAIDRSRLAIGGFSDGASYALSLGLGNGDLFSHVVAFSPGFIALERTVGKPRIFLSHGRNDEVLPINPTSRKILPRLESTGYDVTYREFDGPHTIPEPIAREAVEWLVQEV